MGTGGITCNFKRGHVAQLVIRQLQEGQVVEDAGKMQRGLAHTLKLHEIRQLRMG